ncbi:MAG TPA: putative sugar nucleotidyl transferase [Gemmatimonadaceae bacterium]|nr:putative sugar nucleotidyl transferase [Gemmatimonadaceae bacterium]
MTELYLYDDAQARAFQPFSLMRPTGELRAGALLLRERWEWTLDRPAAGQVSAAVLRDFAEAGAPRAASGPLPAGAILANTRCAVALVAAPDADVWRCNGRVAAVRLRAPLALGDLRNGQCALEELVAPGARSAEIVGRWIDAVWDFIGDLPAQLTEDIAHLRAGAAPLAADQGARTGHHLVLVERDAVVEPMVFFDVTAGPVLVREGATVQAFTRLVGPCVVGRHSVVSAGRVAASSIGEACKVHGELSTSILLGHSNKGHEGFVGHSYLGRWVNLGAGTTTSNLKNTYGPVSLWTPEGMRDTGLQFLGAMLGDHAKTGIGVRLTTGTVVGAGANVFGGSVMPKVVPPFAWGDAPPFGTHEFDRFLMTAERMMQRRGVSLTEAARAQLRAAYAARWTVE